MARQSRSLAWGLATAVGLAGLLAGYVAHAGLVNHTPKQVVRVSRLTDMVGLEESPAISPDGKAVAFVAEGQIWVRRLDGGVPQAITKDGGEHEGPRWVDSGRIIFYSAGNVWEISAAGGEARRLGDAVGPGDWSHDGKTLALFRSRDNAVELVAGERVVTRLKAGSYSNLRWSPDDQRLAYLDGSALMVVKVSSGELVRAAEGGLRGFAWAPDGSGLIVSLAKASIMPGLPAYDLWFVPRVGDTQSQLTFGESSYVSPDVNAKGDVVVSRVIAKSDIWKFPVTREFVEDDARRAVRITRQTGLVRDVAVSPDENEVAFLSDSGGHANVWVVRVSDGAMRPLTHESNPQAIVGAPSWSRTDWIQFLLNGAAWEVKSDGTESRRTTDLGGSVPTPEFSGNVLNWRRTLVIAGRVAESKDRQFVYAAWMDVDSDILLLSGLKWR